MGWSLLVNSCPFMATAMGMQNTVFYEMKNARSAFANRALYKVLDELTLCDQSAHVVNQMPAVFVADTVS
jgi:hypothetical protein